MVLTYLHLRRGQICRESGAHVPPPWKRPYMQESPTYITPSPWMFQWFSISHTNSWSNLCTNNPYIFLNRYNNTYLLETFVWFSAVLLKFASTRCIPPDVLQHTTLDSKFWEPYYISELSIWCFVEPWLWKLRTTGCLVQFLMPAQTWVHMYTHPPILDMLRFGVADYTIFLTTLYDIIFHIIVTLII